MAHNIKKKDQNKRFKARFQFKKIDTYKCSKFYHNTEMAKFCNVNKGVTIFGTWWTELYQISKCGLKQKLEINSFSAPGSELLGSSVLVLSVCQKSVEK